MNGFGPRLRARRLELGMAAWELAEKIGKHRATVCRYETGEIGAVTVEIVEALATALEVTPAWLLGWEKEMPRSAGTEPRRVLKGYLKHEDRITRTADAVKNLRARKEMLYDEMVEAARLYYPGIDKPLMSKALNEEKYGVRLTLKAAEAILAKAERKSDGGTGSP